MGQELLRSNSGWVLPDYGRVKMEKYAEAFRDLAFNYTKFGCEEVREGESRSEYLERKRESEQWKRLGERLFDIAGMMQLVAGESFSYQKPESGKRARLSRILRKEGIILKNCYIIKTRYGYQEYSLSMQIVGGAARRASRHQRSRLRDTEDVAKVLTYIFGLSIRPAANCPLFVGDQCQEFIFEEQGMYRVATGQATMTKEGENVSGDSFSYLYNNHGKMVALLSDGVGSGENAYKDSAHLIDLAEKYLETGFDKKQTCGVLEGILLGNAMESRMPTLDICEVNLVTGECELLKLGSAPTMICFDRMIDEIPAENLLLGYNKMENMRIEKRQLVEGNNIILMTDGVADCLGEEQKKTIYDSVKNNPVLKDPSCLADFILNLALGVNGGKHRDDMSVLVLRMTSNLC